MPQLIKALTKGQNFYLKSLNMSLSIVFDATNKVPKNLQGALVSPIDCTNLAVSFINIFMLLKTKFYMYLKICISSKIKKFIFTKILAIFDFY